MFVAGEALTQAICKVVAGKSVQIAVAFWGKDAVTRLGLPQDASHITAACDLMSGACNPKAIETLLERNCRLFDVPKLHAKVYLSERGVVVGSANASTNGLGNDFDALTGELEAGDYSRANLKRARIWMNNTLRRGRLVSVNDLPAVWEAWKRSQSRSKANGRFLDALRESRLSDSKMRVAFYAAANPPKREQVLIERAPFYVGNLGYEPYYWATSGWRVQQHDLILDACVDDGELSSDGVMRVVAVWPSVVFVMREELPLGLSFPKADREIFANAIARAYSAAKLSTSDKLQPVRRFSEGLRKYLS